MALTLSILIATMPSRYNQYVELESNLRRQGAFNIFSEVEVIFDNEMSYNIGVKRNKMLLYAKGEYIVFIDDDDEISNNYLSLILEACKSGCDCIGINGFITTNGENEKQWFISKEYGHWHEENNVYYRTPNHISPVKRELALQAMFPEISHAEDFEYSKRLFPLLKTETLINEPIYHYKFISNK